MRVVEIMEGVVACRNGYRCPEGATEAFQRGYGIQYAGEQSGMSDAQIEAAVMVAFFEGESDEILA